jgi:hypothetical protein
MTKFKPMKYLLSIIFICACLTTARAQTDSLDFDDKPEQIKIRSAFSGSTIISGQSTNVSDAGQLWVIIGHRFGTVKTGAFNAFGLDEAVMRMGFEYGILDNLSAGIGRSTAGKNYDGYLKYRLLTQAKGASSGNVPATVTLFTSAAFSSQRLRLLNNNSDENYFISNLVYTYQAMVSKKVSSWLTLQISPTMIHRNQTDLESLAHNAYALGTGLQIKMRGRLSLNVDYSYVWNKDEISTRTLYDPIGIGLEVVTGGHVFKLHFTNSVGIIEKEYLLNTTDDFFKGEVRFGFTLLRSFIVKPKVKGGTIY